MTRLLGAVATLGTIVVAVVLATSLTSSAQTETPDPATTTTLDGRHFQFRFEGESGGDADGELPSEIAEFFACLEEEGFPTPGDGMYEFDSRGFPGALSNCDVPFHEPSFGGELEGPGLEGFRFGEEFDGFPFGREHFPFDELPFADGFGFGFFRLDRDELAACLAELGSFDSVAEVRERLDECLPEPATGDFEFEFDLEQTEPDGGSL